MTAPRLELWRTATSLSLSEASRVLRLSRAHAYRLADTGELPTYVDPLGRRRVRPSDLARLVDGQPGLYDDQGA